jgi:hypothetical protein
MTDPAREITDLIADFVLPDLNFFQAKARLRPLELKIHAIVEDYGEDRYTDGYHDGRHDTD